MPIGILEVKLGRPCQMPERRLRSILEEARRDCCRARNAAITHWLLWRRSNPDWEPGGPYDAPPLKIKRVAKPVDPSKKPSKDPPYAPRAFLSREMYGVAANAVPCLNTSVVSSCAQEVNARLKANTPYNHDGPARWVWQAVLNAEVSLPTWRGGKIPLPRSVARLTKTDDACTLRIPLLSRKSSMAVISPVVRLHVSDLSVGRRRILSRLASGELRLADSQIVERKGTWYVQFCYDVPIDAVDLPTDRVLTVCPSLPGARRPFSLMWIADDEPGDVNCFWGIGNGRPLIAEYRRVVARRRALRARYSDGCGSGHGRKRWYRTIKPLSRCVTDMTSRFTKQTVADIIKKAIEQRCGSILYREPTMPVRNIGWFAKSDVPFDWVSFESRLSFKCETHGIEYDKQRIGVAEWRPKKEAG